MIVEKLSAVKFIKKAALLGIRNLLSQKSRNQKIDIATLMKCQSCGGTELAKENNAIICKKCQKRYNIKNGIIDAIN